MFEEMPMPTPHTFGGPWTEEKLERIQKYLIEYRKIFNANPRARYLRTMYVDAFAGTGYRGEQRQGNQGTLFAELADPDVEGFLKGSAYKALEVNPPFDRYIFVEQKSRYAQDLDNLKASFPDRADRISVLRQDANAYLQEWCSSMDWRTWRAVVFLDPYGMQVEWSSIVAIAQTRSIDLWLLFPLGVAVSRLLTKKELPPPEWAAALTRLFGTADWEQEFYRTVRTPTLFGELEHMVRDADFASISTYFVKRLRTVFAGVAESPLPLLNSRGIPLYLLCFAAGNPRVAPTAVRIAQHLLRS
jgi:three-Cys-motif partner protein